MRWTLPHWARKPGRTNRSTLSVESLETRDVPTASPYVLPSNPAVTTQAIMTVGDSVNLKPDGVTPYRMVGIPDGLGAFDNGDGTFTLLMNHELGTTVGIARESGSAGAFVSEWVIRKSDLTVLSVRDFIGDATSIYLSNNDQATSTPHTGYIAQPDGRGYTTTITRLCSGDMAAPSAYIWTDPDTGVVYGTDARIFQSGEESSGTVAAPVGAPPGETTINIGRQFAWIASDDTGIPGDQANTAYEIPNCGLFAWENNVANPLSQRKTIVIGTDDTSPAGQLYVWVGDKQTTGNVVERAGLTRQSADDNLFVVKVTGLGTEASGATIETQATPSSGAFTLELEGDVSGKTGTQLESQSNSLGGTKFLRPEDGAWDPNNPSDFYFVTTNQYDQVKDGVGTTIGRSRLYRLHFTDISNPAAGGTITCLLDGTEAGNMFDNITVDTHGRVMLQEDVGGQAHNGKVWMYEIATDRLVEVAHHDAARFGDVGVAATAPFNNDEESSGILDVSSILGPGKYLLDVQAHYSLGGELAEGGQLLMMEVPVPPTVASVQINDGSAQRSKVNEITVTLNGVVPESNIGAGAFTLTRAEGGSFTATVAGVTEVGGTTQVTLAFAGPGVGADGSLPDGTYSLSVDGSLVADQLGQKLDSDNDGITDGPATEIASFETLFGDLNGDGHVDGEEVAASAHANGAHLGDAAYLWFLDFDGDGVINGADHRQVARRNG